VLQFLHLQIKKAVIKLQFRGKCFLKKIIYSFIISTLILGIIPVQAAENILTEPSKNISSCYSKRPIWEFFIDDQDHTINTPVTIASDGTIYFGTEKSYLASDSDERGKIYSISSTGKKNWSITTDHIIVGKIALDNDGNVYFSTKGKIHHEITPTATYDTVVEKPFIYSIAPNGNVRWKKEAINNIPPLIFEDINNNVYIDNHYFLYVPTEKGEVTKEINFEETFSEDISINDLNKWAFIRDYSHYENGRIATALRAVNEEGKIIWETFLDKEYSYSPNRSIPTIAKDRTIYIGTYEGMIALNPDGSKKWEINLHDSDLAYAKTISITNRDSTFLSRDEKTIYFVRNFTTNNRNAKVYAINAITGEVDWMRQVDRAFLYGVAPDDNLLLSVEHSMSRSFVILSPKGEILNTQSSSNLQNGIRVNYYPSKWIQDGTSILEAETYPSGNYKVRKVSLNAFNCSKTIEN